MFALGRRFLLWKIPSMNIMEAEKSDVALRGHLPALRIPHCVVSSFPVNLFFVKIIPPKQGHDDSSTTRQDRNIRGSRVFL